MERGGGDVTFLISAAPPHSLIDVRCCQPSNPHFFKVSLQIALGGRESKRREEMNILSPSPLFCQNWGRQLQEKGRFHKVVSKCTQLKFF